ncbi:sulfite exporter TauE/SafE family protein [Elusimicrobiota bacterium]
MNELTVLLISAASMGFFHTLFGPDHYLPFIVMGKARKWSMTKTAVITFISGVAHVGSSVLLGFLGVAFGIAVNRLEIFESVRGSIAAWMLIAFGLVYFIWGLRRAFKEHSHSHQHMDENSDITPWVLFTIFIFGPCEPLIPLLMYPAAKHNIFGVILVALMFGLVTIATMLIIVLMSVFGTNIVKLHKMERYAHAFAGGIVLFSGLAIQFLGL